MFRKTAFCIAILLISILLTSCNEYRKILKSPDLSFKYSKAVEYYNKGDYHRAMQLFDELLIYYRGNDTSEQIAFYYAYSYYGQGDFLQAGYYFVKFTSTFPASRYTEECAYMGAYCAYMYSPSYSLDQSTTSDALKGLQLFVDEYPQSKRIEDCNRLIDELRSKLEQKSFEIARLYLKIESYQAAVIALRNHLKDFPDTRFREDTYYLILRSQFMFALKSVESRKKERLQAAIDAYNALFSTYPETRFADQAKSIYKNITKELNKINTIKTKS